MATEQADCLRAMRRISPLLLGLGLMLLAGCAPPPPAALDSGHKIYKVVNKPAPPYRSMVVDGMECRVSRYPIGKFGGSYYNTSVGRGPKTFNPLAAKDATSGTLGGMMFVGLTDTDPHSGAITPLLAKSVAIQPDQKTYRVTMRKGLLWSDGQPLTADDVLFTWQQIILPGLGNPSERDTLMIDGKLPTVRKIDADTLEFVTPKPFAPFQADLGTSIFPKHVVEPIIRNNPKAFDSFWGVSAKPATFVGNGPFILDEYISGQRAIFRRNPHYMIVNRQGRHLPYIDRFVVDFVQDPNAEVLQFEQGHVDDLAIAGNQVFYVKHLMSPSFRMVDLGPNTGTSFVVFNLDDRKNKETGKPYVDPVRSGWFRNLDFRKAVDYAINRDDIVSSILMGVGKPLFTSEALSSIYLNHKLAGGHPRDLNQSRAFLRAGGFRWNADGRLLDAQGHPVVFELTTNAGNPERESVAVLIKQDLEQLGMQVNFKSVDFNVLVGRFDTNAWEAMVLGLTGSNTEPNGGRNVWDSNGAMHLFNKRNPQTDMPGSDHVFPWEKQLDRLMQDGATTLDLAQRHRIYDACQQLIYDNLPFIYLYSGESIVAVRNRVQNIDPAPYGGLTHNIESLWIKR